METLQWTMLVGLLGMLLYVLWHRMRASFGQGVPPQVAADWEGEGALWSNGVVDIHLRVLRTGDVALSVHVWTAMIPWCMKGSSKPVSMLGMWRCQWAPVLCSFAWRAKGTERSAGCIAKAEVSHALGHVDAEHGHAIGDGFADQGCQSEACLACRGVFFFCNRVVLVKAREGLDQIVAVVGDQ